LPNCGVSLEINPPTYTKDTKEKKEKK
jgi:hypothetical protein